MFADPGSGKGIEGAARGGTVAEAIVARILVKNGRQKSIAERVADDVIAVSDSDAFSVSSGAPAGGGIVIVGLTKARNNRRERKGIGVDGGSELQLELLGGTERDG